MSKILFATAALTLLAMDSSAQNKKSETIKGNGKIVTRNVSVQPFEALKASGIYELNLSQGDKESVRIDADENLQEYIEVRNDGPKLIIDMKKLENKNIHFNDKLRVFVTFKKLTNLELKTVGNVLSKEIMSFDNLEVSNKSVGHVDLNLTANKLDLQNKSVGNVKLTGKAQDAVVRNSGVGSLQAGNFLVQTMNIENTGVGSAEVNAEKNLKVKDSFLGKVRNKGAATARRMNKVVI